jgi:DNA-binding response OmpR family regulator
MARAKALIRRGEGHSAATIKVQDVEIDTVRRRASRAGRVVVLSAIDRALAIRKIFDHADEQ